MDILLGMAAAKPPPSTSTSILSTPTSSTSMTTPTTAAIVPPVGMPIHQLYEGNDFFILLVYSPSKAVITCKFSLLTVEVKAIGTAINSIEAMRGIFPVRELSCCRVQRTALA